MDDAIYTIVQPFNNGKSIKAFADISLDTGLGEISISGIKIIQKDDNKPFIIFPSISFKDDKTGDFKNRKILSFSKRLEKMISNSVLKEYESIK